MNQKYTSASARVQALASGLLSQSQVELLVGAKGNEELFTVLFDTYLAPYLKRNTERDILDSLEEQIADTKAVLIAIVPDPAVLDLLWVKYDYHNLKTVVKGLRAGLTDAEILQECYTQALVAPEHLLAHIHAETLEKIAPELVAPFARAREATLPEQIGQICDHAYFLRMQDIARASKDTFAMEYVSILIDMYNVKVLARGELHETFRTRRARVAGGACSLPETFDVEHLARTYARYGGVDAWKKVLTGVLETKSTSALEKFADDVVTDWIKHAGLADFCLADIVRYFHAVKNNAQIISAIVKATRADMPEKDLRAILRTLYV
jgi:V/A-type H+-transporting ATPase subunit C